MDAQEPCAVRARSYRNHGAIRKEQVDMAVNVERCLVRCGDL